MFVRGLSTRPRKRDTRGGGADFGASEEGTGDWAKIYADNSVFDWQMDGVEATASYA